VWPTWSIATVQIGGGAPVLDNFFSHPHTVHVWFIYIACSRRALRSD